MTKQLTIITKMLPRNSFFIGQSVGRAARTIAFQASLGRGFFLG